MRKQLVDPKYSFSVETITPQKAQNYLKYNLQNRVIGQRRVRQFAEDMKAGHWRVTNQGIAFTNDGALVDGQHRLNAVILANTAVEMLVVRGIETDARSCVDIGQSRTAGQTLQYNGVANGFHVASTLTLVQKFMCGEDHMHISPNIYLDLVSQFPQAVQVCTKLNSAQRTILRTPIRAAIVFAWKADPEKVKEFFDRLTDGANLDSGSPILQLREFAIGWATNPQALMHSEGPRNAMFRKALNAIRMHLTGKKSDKLQESAASTKYFMNLHGIDPVEVSPVLTLTSRQRTQRAHAAAATANASK